MELIKNGDILNEKITNHIVCPHCGKAHRVTIEDVTAETISYRSSCDYIYSYHCTWCNQKIQITFEEYGKLLECPDFWIVKRTVHCSNSECKAEVELLPENFYKVRKGIFHHTKQRMWECPRCGQKNFIHKHKLSSSFDERIKHVITIKEE